MELIRGQKLFAVDVHQDAPCEDCFFRDAGCTDVWTCDPRYREDSRDIYFVSTDDLRLWTEYHQQEETTMQ